MRQEMKARPAHFGVSLCNNGMKNKPVTYFLIAAVIGLWGMIIYRVLTAVTQKDDDDAQQLIASPKETFDDYSIPPDTSKLLLNYRDPFGIVKQKDTVSAARKMPTAPNRPAESMKPAVNWSFITYSGYIRNPNSRKLVALVNINGQTVTLIEGETKNQVKLLKNLRDSIKVSYAGHTKFIARKWL
jgi:hypothetical protein